jgi:hypothetical protein
MRNIFKLLLLLIAINPASASSYEVLTHSSNERAQKWKIFGEKVYQLHEKQLTGRSIQETREPGGYKKYPDSYVEVSYYDKASGLLLSRIKWRTDQPDKVHTIEVFVYDEKQQLVRDYTVAYIAFYYDHLRSQDIPNQALVNFYNQHETLKAFRSFDASGDFVYEACSGTFEGKPVEISNDDGESEDEVDNSLKSKIYKACFDGVLTSPGEYLDPH